MNTLKRLVTMLMLLALPFFGAHAWTLKAVKDDPLVRMPGTQPGQITLEGPGRCLNCHADYNHSVEPGFNWKGSMMAQASRDFLYWTCQTVAAQDAIWAVGNPNATDICARCHFPIGWLEGRSDPTNNSLMRGDDYDGVNCDFCHTLYNPFFENAYSSDPEGKDSGDWASYWDEASSLSSDEATLTYFEDETIAQGIMLFNGIPMFGNNQPVTKAGGYVMNAGGQYFNSPNSQKRSSYADPKARHQVLYSRYHKSKYFCSTCHDISNPILHNLTNGYAETEPGDGSTILPTESDPAHSYFHVERTFSEFMLSDYALPGGAPGKGPFAPGLFDTSLPGDYIGKCQDCHMRDVVGVGCNKAGAPIRPDESTEHPNSGLPLHDLTGGNAWVAGILASATPGSPNYDQANYDLLHAPNLTLDLAAGNSNEPEAMIAGMERSKQQLQLASTIEPLIDLGQGQEVIYDSSTGLLNFRVHNNTGHKLPSGFPEGRRIFVNVVATYSDGSTYEINPYDEAAGTLKGLPYTYDGLGDIPPYLPQDIIPLVNGEVYVDELVYEAHTSSYLTEEDHHTFHFALATDRDKDNRIPPKGFQYLAAQERLAETKWHGVSDDKDISDNYYTDAEYAGGYDDISLTIPAGATNVKVNLYYQTTSREYIEFLRNEANGGGNLTLFKVCSVETDKICESDADCNGETNRCLTPSGETEPYIVQTDPFFAELTGWGNALWGLWVHNMNQDGAKPFLMAQAVYGAPPEPCGAPAPTLLSTQAASGQVTLNWSDEHSANENVVGYNVYYDQSGKSQFLADAGLNTSHTDTGLVNGQQYCYKVTSKYACESEFSNVLCATPEAPGQGTVPVGVDSIATGYYSGKGKTSTFDSQESFAQGDEVVFRATVLDQNGAPIEGATVDFSITGPTTATVSTGTSDAEGIAEGSWKTATRKGGTTTCDPGVSCYTATTTSVTATGYEWDGSPTNITFEIQ
jgi:hypothetical protein